MRAEMFGESIGARPQVHIQSDGETQVGDAIIGHHLKVHLVLVGLCVCRPMTWADRVVVDCRFHHCFLAITLCVYSPTVSSVLSVADRVQDGAQILSINLYSAMFVPFRFFFDTDDQRSWAPASCSPQTLKTAKESHKKKKSSQKHLHRCFSPAFLKTADKHRARPILPNGRPIG
jgi:hypothetical protein